MDEYLNSYLNYWVLKGEEVYHVSVPVVAAPVLDGKTVLVYRAQVKELASSQTDPKNVIVGEIAICQFKRAERNVIAVRAIYDLLGTKKYDCQLGGPELDALLKGKDASKETIRYEILAYLIRRADEHPGRSTTVLELIAAVRRSPNELIKSLNNLEARQRLHVHLSKGVSRPNTFDDLVSSDDYSLTHDYFHRSVLIPPDVDDKVRREVEEHRKDAVAHSKEWRPSSDPYKHYKIITIEAEASKSGFIFCMTEFSGDSLRRFSEVIEPLCEPEFGMPAVISKNDDLPYKIDDKVVSHIHKCSMAIADISTRNPNVMYEMGFAHAANKDVIIICDSALKGEKEIFDIRNINTIFFDSDEHLREELKKKIRAVLNTAVATGSS